MKKQQFDFFEEWNCEESMRFLETLKRKKIEFCKEYGLPVPAFDKEEDFFVTSAMIAWAQGEEKPVCRLQRPGKLQLYPFLTA